MSDQIQQNEVIQELMRMLEIISQNAGYLRYFENQNVLVDPKIYFDICQIIFSEMSIKMIKIQEYEGYDDGQKLDCLIKLITEELGYHMPKLSGKQIIKFNISHIYEFLDLLLNYSKLYFERGSGAIQPSIKTQPNQISDDYQRQDGRQRNPFSARPPGIVQYSPKSSHQDREKHKGFKQNRNNRNHKNDAQKNGGFSKTKNNGSRPLEESNHMGAQYGSQNKNKKSQLLYDELVKVVIDQKNRANKSSLRDQRKNKNEDISAARNKYHQYLKSYSKQKRAETQRKSIVRKKCQAIEGKSNARQLPLADFENVSNFFKSFNYKLRDMKDVYLRRMKNQIRKKQQQKMVSKNRKQRQRKQEIQKNIGQQLQCLDNEHKLRRSEIKEAVNQLQQQITLVQKEMKRKSSIHKKQLKDMKKMDLKNLQNLIRQQNQRVLMELQPGGRMERLILDVYGKF